MNAKHILVVEDEEDIQELITYNLKKENYQVYAVSSGERAIKYAQEKLPDLIILDLMLPGIDGFEVCKRLKNNDGSRAIPIVMLTAKGEEADIVTGLELGADDYITKPFSPRILIARIRTILRRETRTEAPVQEVIKRGNLTIDVARHQVLVHGKPITLTSTEY